MFVEGGLCIYICICACVQYLYLWVWMCMCAHVCIVCRGDKMNVHRCMFKGCMCVPYTWCACGGQKTACGNSSVLLRGFHGWN